MVCSTFRCEPPRFLWRPIFRKNSAMSSVIRASWSLLRKAEHQVAGHDYFIGRKILLNKPQIEGSLKVTTPNDCSPFIGVIELLQVNLSSSASVDALFREWPYSAHSHEFWTCDLHQFEACSGPVFLKYSRRSAKLCSKCKVMPEPTTVQKSRFSTDNAFCWINSRRGSTTSPINLVKMSSASARSPTFT